MNKKPTNGDEKPREFAAKEKRKPNLAATQRGAPVSEIEEKLEEVAKATGQKFMDDMEASAKKRIQQETAQLKGQGIKPNVEAQKKYLEKIKAKAGKIGHEIFKSVSIMKKCYKNPSSDSEFTLEPMLEGDDNIYEKDNITKFLYVTIELPLNYSRKGFVDAVKSTFNGELVKKDEEADDFEVVGSREFAPENKKDAQKVIMKTLIVPLQKVVFPPKQPGGEVDLF